MNKTLHRSGVPRSCVAMAACAVFALGVGGLPRTAHAMQELPVSPTIDLNNDGVVDQLVVRLQPTQANPVSGAGQARDPLANMDVAIHCGATGQPFRRFLAPVHRTLFGASVLLVPDSDGDGLADVVVGAPGFGRVEVDGASCASGCGQVYLFSSATGAIVRTWQGVEGQADVFGFEQRLIPDFSGDGLIDLQLIGYHRVGNQLRGRSRVISLTHAGAVCDDSFVTVSQEFADADWNWKRSDLDKNGLLDANDVQVAASVVFGGAELCYGDSRDVIVDGIADVNDLITVIEDVFNQTGVVKVLHPTARIATQRVVKMWDQWLTGKISTVGTGGISANARRLPPPFTGGRWIGSAHQAWRNDQDRDGLC